MRNCCTYDRLHDFSPLCALDLCIIVSYDILNQVLLVPSCYQQLMPKIFIITLLSMQVRALQITETEFPAIVLFFFAYYKQKECKTKGGLLENNALVTCCKTRNSWIYECRVRFSTVLATPPQRPCPPSFIWFQMLFFKGHLSWVFGFLWGKLFTHLEVSNTLRRKPWNEMRTSICLCMVSSCD